MLSVWTWRRVGLLLLLLACTTGPLISIAHADRNTMTPIRFAIIGDRTGDHQPDIYEQIVTEVSRLRPDFIMTTGDMIEGYVDDSLQIHEQWQEFKYLISPLTSPIHFTPGNHEIWSEQAEQAYREHVGRTYYSFNFEKLHVVVLDASRWESANELPPDQLRWLNEDLKAYKSAYYTLVFFHKPFWWETIVYNKPDTLHQLFKKYGVDAVFSGHFHQYFSAMYDGIKYTCLGSSGGSMGESDFGKMGYHYLWVTVDSRGVHIAPVRMGSVMAWEEMSIADRKIFDLLARNGIRFNSPIEVAENLTVRNSTVSFTVDNSIGNYPVIDTVRWDAQSQWSVKPRTLPIYVPPHEKRTYSINLACKGAAFPPPSAEIEFQYAKDKTITARKSLPLTRTAYCVFASEPPTIDGSLDEDVWKSPEVKFFDENGLVSETEPTMVYFAYDRDHLYIAAHCHESQIDALKTAATEQDGAVYSDDCIGLFLEPAQSEGKAYQLYFNANGIAFDQKLIRDVDGYFDGDLNWHGMYEVRTSRGADFWNLEVCIPLDQFGEKLACGDKWRVNFRRKQARLGKSADWQIPIDRDPATFGVLVAR